jgi:SagB-type dehydrogenase family enzyme
MSNTVGGAMPMIEEQLPAPLTTGQMPLEKTIARRRSEREFSQRSLTRGQIAQLCWAGQGITAPQEQLRSAPSAGALYPIELYVATGANVGHFQPNNMVIKQHVIGDIRPQLRQLAVNQEMITQAPVTFVIAAAVARTACKYGNRAERYCFMEAGHVAQNMLLQATALNLGAVPIGAFEDRRVAALLELPKGQRVLYLISVGHLRR